MDTLRLQFSNFNQKLIGREGISDILFLVVAFERDINEDVVALHDHLWLKLDSLCVGPTEWNLNLLLCFGGFLALSYRTTADLCDQRLSVRLLSSLKFKARFKIPLLEFNTISGYIVPLLIR